MSASSSPQAKVRRSRKVRSVLAGGLVLGVGAVFTLAAWTDNEWVFGKNDKDAGGPGVKSYAMEQNTYTGTEGDKIKWSDQGAKDGGALTFSVNADKLVPGATVYAPMQLRTKAGSEALTVPLAEGVQKTPVDATTNSTPLYEALTYTVKQGVPKGQCSAGGFAGTGTVLVPSGALTTTSGATTVELPAGSVGEAGAPADLCFALTLPSSADSSLQGKQTVPLWRFTSTVGN